MQEKEKFVRRFREVQPKFTRFFAQRLVRARLTLPQFALLTQLLDQDRVSMTELSRRLHISKPAVTSLADRLEKNKFLKRLTHPGDRRVSPIQILQKGEKLVRTVQAQALGVLLKTLGTFNAEEKRTISHFYGRLSQTLDRALAETKKARK